MGFIARTFIIFIFQIIFKLSFSLGFHILDISSMDQFKSLNAKVDHVLTTSMCFVLTC